MIRVHVLDQISAKGLSRLPGDRYQFTEDILEAEVILLRSTNIHQLEVPPGLKAVGRAGAGVNNIPVDAYGHHGIPVFNAPGANANAVKELVIAGLLMSGRNLCPAWNYVRQLEGDARQISKAVETGKRQFAGFELPGRTMGVVGLGYIGRLVANTCLEMGMKVTGYDPMLTVEGAWQLSSGVRKSRSLEKLVREVDYISLHVPLDDDTRDMINDEILKHAKPGLTILNFARGGIVDDRAVCDAIDKEIVAGYVTDFPNPTIINHPGVIALPHLGASTLEAEENCAVMVVDQVRSFMEDGNIINSVNYPNVSLERGTEYRMVVVNSNVPSMLGQISTSMANAGLNIHDMINQSKDDLAYTIVDADSPIAPDVVKQIAAIDGVILARLV